MHGETVKFTHKFIFSQDIASFEAPGPFFHLKPPKLKTGFLIILLLL